MENKVKSINNNYKLYTLSTDNARVDKPIHLAGNSILIVSSPVNINIKLHRIDNEIVPLQQYDSIVEKQGFDRFYISHSALSGATIKFLVYTDVNLFIALGAGASAGGGRATTIGNGSLALTLAGTEYSVALTDNTKRLKLINNSVDAIFYVSLLALDSGNGVVIPPLASHNIENIDLESYILYIQSDVASRTLYYWEFL